MHFQNLALFAVTLASVSAFPAKIAKRDWVNDDNGNIKITFSDQTIKLGTIKISEIIDSLYRACKDEGQCDTSAIDIKGQLIEAGAEGRVDDETLTINPSGSYPTWIHNGLLETLNAAVQAVATCEDVTQWSGCASVMAYCPPNKITVNECTVPQYWGINYQAADSSNAAPPFIGADMSIVVDKGGFCDTFTTVGNAVAGAVNGAAGGIFTLAGLFCQD